MQNGIRRTIMALNMTYTLRTPTLSGTNLSWKYKLIANSLVNISTRHTHVPNSTSGLLFNLHHLHPPTCLAKKLFKLLWSPLYLTSHIQPISKSFWSYPTFKIQVYLESNYFSSPPELHRGPSPNTCHLENCNNFLTGLQSINSHG